jgi:hypothetical protein
MLAVAACFGVVERCFSPQWFMLAAARAACKRPYGKYCAPLANSERARTGEDALDHSQVFDQSDHAHLRAAFRADERIDLVDLANQRMPGKSSSTS